MSYHYDFLMRQIEIILAMLRYLLTGEKTHITELDSRLPGVAADNPLYLRLQLLVRKGEICQAENLLYEALEEEPGQQVLDAAVRFYDDLNRLSDDDLAAGSFSREEILDGLTDICHRLGIPMETK